MAADIINLNKARKTKIRSESEKRASQNRVRFGRTKAEKEREQAEQTLLLERFKGLKIDPAPDKK